MHLTRRTLTNNISINSINILRADLYELNANQIYRHPLQSYLKNRVQFAVFAYWVNRIIYECLLYEMPYTMNVMETNI